MVEEILSGVFPVGGEWKEISVEDMQKIVDANERIVKELRYGTNTISK